MYGGILSSPVRKDTAPVIASAMANGNEARTQVFATAILSFPPFHGLLFDDQTPATRRMIAKTRAIFDWEFASIYGSAFPPAIFLLMYLLKYRLNPVICFASLLRFLCSFRLNLFHAFTASAKTALRFC